MGEPDALIVYHEPGVGGSETLLYPLVDRLRGLGFEALLAPLGEALRGCPAARRVYLLMFARGGHWLSLFEACGRPPLYIPPHVSAAGLARAVGAGASLVILYRRAKRLQRLYTRDVAAIAAGLAAAGVRAYPLEASAARRAWLVATHVAPLALLPGRLQGLAEWLAGRLGARPVEPFALHSLDLVASWIASTLEEDGDDALVAAELSAGEELEPSGLGERREGRGGQPGLP